MIVYLSLGSNLGDRWKALETAIHKLNKLPDVRNIIASEFIETSPVGYVKQPDFINCAVRLETNLSPVELLKQIQQIEVEMGRERVIKWGPRIIDIDILFYENKVIQQENLIIPHPELHRRYFVLRPLMELCPDFIHPILRKSISSLYSMLREELSE